MIPSSNNFQNENLYNQKIKIQLTNDNRCIIQSTIETPNKSEHNTINKSEKSININYTDNDNDIMSLSKSINSILNNTKINCNDNNKSNKKLNNNENNLDNDGNSNLLISFSNISELTKINNDNSIFGGVEESNKKNAATKKNENDTSSILNQPLNNYYENSKIYENKIDINNKNKSINLGLSNKSEYSNDKVNLVSSSKKSNSNLLNRENSNISDISDIVNWNINNKSILSNKDKDKDKNKEQNNNKSQNDNLDNINIKEEINTCENKKNNLNDNKKVTHKKVFKYIQTENTNVIQINNINDKFENNLDKDKIMPNHCTNFSFGGNIINNNINHFLINNINNINIENVSTKLNLGNNSNNNYTDAIKNDDYISPTFNINLDFNALDSNNLSNNKMKKENQNKDLKINKKEENKNIEEKKIVNNKQNIKENEDKNILNSKNAKASQMSNKNSKENLEELKDIKIITKEKKTDTYLNKNKKNNIIVQHLIYKERRNKSFNSLNNNSNSNSNISESIHFYSNINNDFNNLRKINKINKSKHSYLDSNKFFNNNILNRLYGTNHSAKPCSSPNQNVIHTYNHFNTNEEKKSKKKISHNKSKSNSGNISKINSHIEKNILNFGKILSKNKSSNQIQSKSKEKQKSKNNSHSKNKSLHNNSSKLNKITILNKDQLNILEIRKKIRKSPVPKINKLSPPSKMKIDNSNSNSHGHNSGKETLYKKDKKHNNSSKNEKIFFNHKYNIHTDESRKKINLAIKKTSPCHQKNIHSNNNSNLIGKNYINKKIGNLINENNNIKLKISKNAINNYINEFKPQINDYSDIIANTTKAKNVNNKHKSFIYNRKRNCSFGYNHICNSSNNLSKDSNKNYHNKTIQNSQSGENSKISNKQSSSKLNSFNYSNCFNLNKNSNKQISNKNNNLILSKFQGNKKSAINKQSKKFTIIQNFSRYKKKSTFINNNSENNYLINDENYNRENIIRTGYV